MPSYALAQLALCLLMASRPVLGHVAIWHPSVYGVNASGRAPDQLFNQPVNTNFLAQPIRKFDHLKYRDWWFHGVVDAKPDAVMELPVGESINIEHACNKAWTTLGSNPDRLDIVGDIPCDINNRGGKAHYGDPKRAASNGILHTTSAEGTKGCGLGIAYTDDAKSVKPEDFTIFSVNHTCVWTRNTRYEIPEDLPPCPNGKCTCFWGWIHAEGNGEGYGSEMYMVGFDCNVVNSKSTRKVAKPKPAVECRGKSEKCVAGAKQGLFWEGAVDTDFTIPLIEGQEPPSYNWEWGFANGAQNGIFEHVAAASLSPAKAAAAMTRVVDSTSYRYHASYFAKEESSSTTTTTTSRNQTTVVTVEDARKRISAADDKRRMRRARRHARAAVAGPREVYKMH